ncbi:MAG: polyphosphate kinase 1 [Flavobacteriales bacterium]|nr:polyphosphate kinase 1 [Flavobacteriales bacterium]
MEARQRHTLLLERARDHVRRWFARRMPARLRFHDVDHTFAVTRVAVSIGQALQVGARELLLLELAALFHDTGYALAYRGHEERSAELADAFLLKQGMSHRDRSRIRSLILATRLGSPVRDKLAAILRDADSAKAGQADFKDRSDRLRKELEEVTGKRMSDKAWAESNLAYLRGHRFYTAYARRRYGPQKRLNLEQTKALVASARKRIPTTSVEHRFAERDISWLSFNERVLQEAGDPRNPLLERVKFLAIFSSNLDEFYRVRVASLRGLSKLKRRERAGLGIPVDTLITRINRKALVQQRRFGALWRGTLLPGMARQGIRFLNEGQLSRSQQRFVRAYFAKHVAPLLITANARATNAPFIEDRKLYFACRIRTEGKPRPRTVLVNIPSEELGRFVVLPSRVGRVDLLFLDDAIRHCLDVLFAGHEVLHCHAFKLSRDAELYLDEEFGDTVKEKVRRSLRKRSLGVPSRFLYDAAMPQAVVKELRGLLDLRKADLVPGSRYHNFSDLIRLPVKGRVDLRDRVWKPIQHPVIGRSRQPFKVLGTKDQLLHLPYHDYGGFVTWLRQAARDPSVRHIRITLYRVAEGSVVCAALLEALEQGKRVTAFVEVQARFDERANLQWGERLERAGATVLYSHEGLKVHCKLCLLERSEDGRISRYAYLGTGNFNERTSRLYADDALVTAHEGITRDVASVFDLLQNRRKRPKFKHLLVAPHDLRNGLEALVDKEMERASQGLPAAILLKLNSLEDHAFIAKLYDASRVGVDVRLIIRGICCLVPGMRRLSERIQAISIVDRYLEHSRAYVFHNNGSPLVYLSSADCMERNLDRRVEVAFPLLDSRLRQEMMELLELQWADNMKARIIDARQSNAYRNTAPTARAVHAQADTYRFLKRLARKGR